MKKLHLLLPVLLALAVFGCQPAEQAPAPETETMEETPERLLRHVVLFAFKEEASAEDVKSVCPQAPLAGLSLSHEGLEAIKVLRRLLVVACLLLIFSVRSLR